MRLCTLATVCLLLAHIAPLLAAPPAIEPVAGLRDRTPRVQALVGGRIVQRPGQVIESGTVVVRDGVIVAVGEKVDVPADARVWDAKGKTIYAGFIDAYTEQAITADKVPSAARHWSKRVTPEL